ncbi:hypothetical protein [Nocardioides pantholopis]|uniref:hypothetical protein n=1 Tax=Nocardioides pantholopis TaxID=2483798 RepID=UPI000F08843D|nr:hypothetical protein [Nocardioides pantholopis]
MKFEAIVKDLVEELRTSSTTATSGSQSAGSSPSSSGASTEALIAAGTALAKEIVTQVVESVERMRSGAPRTPGAAEAEEKASPGRGSSEIEALVRRVIAQARELASQDRADLVRQLARPDLLLTARGRAPKDRDEVRGRVEL